MDVLGNFVFLPFFPVNSMAGFNYVLLDFRKKKCMYVCMYVC